MKLNPRWKLTCGAFNVALFVATNIIPLVRRHIRVLFKIVLYNVMLVNIFNKNKHHHISPQTFTADYRIPLTIAILSGYELLASSESVNIIILLMSPSFRFGIDTLYYISGLSIKGALISPNISIWLYSYASLFTTAPFECIIIHHPIDDYYKKFSHDHC